MEEVKTLEVADLGPTTRGRLALLPDVGSLYLTLPQAFPRGLPPLRVLTFGDMSGPEAAPATQAPQTPADPASHFPGRRWFPTKAVRPATRDFFPAVCSAPSSVCPLIF